MSSAIQCDKESIDQDPPGEDGVYLSDSANFVVSTVSENVKEDTNPTLNAVQAPHPYMLQGQLPLATWAACLSQAEIRNAGIFPKRTNMFLRSWRLQTHSAYNSAWKSGLAGALEDKQIHF